MSTEVIVAVVTTVGTVTGAVALYFQTVKVKKLELEATRAKENETQLKRAAAVPGDVPPEFVAEAALAGAVRVFRRNFTMKMSFRDTAPDLLEMTVELSFTLVNYTTEAVTYVHKMELVPDEPEDVTRILRVAATGADLSRDYDESFPLATPRKLEFLREVTVNPNGANPQNLFETKFQRRTRANDAEVLFFNYATLGAEVKIDGRPDDVEVSVSFSHREGGKAEVLPRGAGHPTRWRLSRAFLPWQAMYVEWHRKSPAPRVAEQGRPDTDGPVRP